MAVGVTVGVLVIVGVAVGVFVAVCVGVMVYAFTRGVFPKPSDFGTSRKSRTRDCVGETGAYIPLSPQ